MLAVCFFAEAAREPIRSQSRHLAQSRGLRKQMGRSLDDRQMFFSFEIFINLLFTARNMLSRLPTMSHVGASTWSRTEQRVGAVCRAC